MNDEIGINYVVQMWRKTPPFLNQRVIQIGLPFACPFGHEHEQKTKITPKIVMDRILSTIIIDPDKPHINQIAFAGDFIQKNNFAFIKEFLKLLEDARIGMYICSETFGSEDNEKLPTLLDYCIIDELMIKVLVYPELDKKALKQVEISLNALSQSISAIRSTYIDTDENIRRNLEKVGINFIFTKDSNLDVFKMYLASLYNAFQKDEEIFDLFDIYLQSDNTEPFGMIDQAYALLIEGFESDHIYCIPANTSRCIFF